MSGLMQEFRQETGFAMRSPLLFEYLDNLAEETRHEFLDILPATQGMVNFFSQFHCKLYLPGCVRQIYEMDMDALDTAQKLRQAFEKQLGLYKNDRACLNMVMLWDLPNFLDKRNLSGLIEHLLLHVHDNVILHTYVYTKRLMPARPGCFYFTGDNQIWFENDPEMTRKCPVYYQEVLQKLMYPFKVKRSILLSNGLQEYTLELRRQ